MSMQWSWEFLDPSGAAMAGPEPSSPAFPTQSEAESWIGEVWPDLVDGGVDAVTLREGETVVYGPMSLRPAE
jgi:hypothetical protein